MPRKKTAAKKDEKPVKKAAKNPAPQKAAPKPVAPPTEEAALENYYEATGRRKTSVARVRLWARGEKNFLVNEKTFDSYFTTLYLRQTALNSLTVMKCLDKFGVSAKVRGGGISSQAEAVRHGIAKALVLFNPDFRKRLKKAGYLIRDPRMRERKKFGLKRARRAPQWAKR